MLIAVNTHGTAASSTYINTKTQLLCCPTGCAARFCEKSTWTITQPYLTGRSVVVCQRISLSTCRHNLFAQRWTMLCQQGFYFLFFYFAIETTELGLPHKAHHNPVLNPARCKKTQNNPVHLTSLYGNSDMAKPKQGKANTYICSLDPLGCLFVFSIVVLLSLLKHEPVGILSIWHPKIMLKGTVVRRAMLSLLILSETFFTPGQLYCYKFY